MMHYVGIDLAWKENGDTGICVLNENGDIVLWEVQAFSNIALINTLKPYIQKKTIIAIDAPISVPNKTGSRASENELKKTKIHQHKISIFSTNRNFMIRNYGTVRGEYIRAMIETENSDFSIEKSSGDHLIFETFPTASCIGIFKKKIKYKTSSNKKELVLAGLKILLKEMKSHDWFSKRILLIEKPIMAVLNKSIKRRDLKLLDDKLDALFCAYTALQFHKNPTGVKRFGEGLEQIIIAVKE